VLEDGAWRGEKKKKRAFPGLDSVAHSRHCRIATHTGELGEQVSAVEGVVRGGSWKRKLARQTREKKGFRGELLWGGGGTTGRKTKKKRVVCLGGGRQSKEVHDDG